MIRLHTTNIPRNAHILCGSLHVHNRSITGLFKLISLRLSSRQRSVTFLSSPGETRVWPDLTAGKCCFFCDTDTVCRTECHLWKFYASHAEVAAYAWVAARHLKTCAVILYFYIHWNTHNTLAVRNQNISISCLQDSSFSLPIHISKYMC